MEKKEEKGKQKAEKEVKKERLELEIVEKEEETKIENRT